MSQGKQRIVVTRKVPDPLVPLLQREGFDVVVHDSVEPMTPDALVAFVRGAHAIVPISDDKMTDAVFAAAGPDLKIVANYAVGYDNVDLAAAVARDVWVTHTVGVENMAVFVRWGAVHGTPLSLRGDRQRGHAWPEAP